MTYPFFDTSVGGWSGFDTLQWCHDNIGTDYSASFTLMLNEFGHSRPIYVDDSGNAGVPLNDDGYAYALIFGEEKTFTRFYFRSAKYAVLAKTSIG